MLQWIGAVFVLTSSTAIGRLLAVRVKEQELWLCDIRSSMYLLLGELEYHQMPLPEALFCAGSRQGGRLRCFYEKVSCELERKEGERFREIWRKYATECLVNAPVGKMQKEEFIAVGTYLTEADQKVRNNAIEFYLTCLEKEIAVLRKNEKEKTHLFQTMGILVGLFLLILVM